MKAVPRLLRACLLTVAGLAAVTVMAAGGLYLWIQTEGGRDWAKQQLETALSEPGESAVEIGDIEGDLPQSPRISDLTLRDAEGVWLRAEGLSLDWRPASLLRGRLEVAQVRAERIEIRRTPEATSEPDPDFSLPSLPGLPVELDLEEVAVETLDLGSEILGEPARFRIEGRSQVQTDGAADALLNIARSDQGRGRLRFEAAYRPDGDTLALTLEVSEPDGGLAAYVLGLPGRPQIQVRLAGEGALSDWRGDLTAELEGLLSAKAALRLQRGTSIGFDLTGEGEVTPPSEAPPWPLLAGRQTLSLSGTWQPPSGLVITALTLEGRQLQTTARADIELAEERIGAEIEAGLKDGSDLAGWIGAENLEGGRAKVILNGPLSGPEITAEVDVTQIGFEGLAIRGLRSRARFDAAETGANGAPAGPLSMTAEAEKIALPGEPALQTVLGQAFKAEFDGHIDLDAMVLETERLVLGGDTFESEVSGRLNFQTGDGDFQTQSRYFDLSRLDNLVGLGLKGGADLNLPLKVAGFGDRVAGKLQGRLPEFGSDVAAVDALLADEPALQSDFAFDPKGFRLDGLKISTPTAEAEGNFALLTAEDKLSGRLRLSLPETGVLSEVLGVTLTGPGEVVAVVEGQSAAPKISGTLSAGSVSHEGFSLSEIKVGYRADRLTPNIAGQVEAQAESPLGPLSAATDLTLDDKTLQLAGLWAELPALRIGGELAAPLDGAPLKGRFEARSQSLSDLLGPMEIAVGGEGKAEITLAEAKGQQSALLEARIDKASFAPAEDAAPIRSAGLDLKLEARDLTGDPSGRVTMTARDLRWQDLKLDRLDLTGNGGPRDVELTLLAEGHWIEALNLDAAGRVELAEGSTQATLQRLQGRAAGEDLRLTAPARLEVAEDNLSLSGLGLAIGPGQVNAEAALNPKNLKAALEFENLPLRLAEFAVPLGLDGRLSGEAKVEGPRNDPQGNFSARAAGLKTSDLADAPESEIAVTGLWQGGRLTLEGSAKAPEVTAARFKADLPLQMDAEGLAPTLPVDRQIEGRLDWAGALAPVVDYLPLADHRLDGRGEIVLSLGGNLSAPEVAGRIALEEAEYESLEAGTLLKDLDLLIELDRKTVRIERLSANDGSGGTLSATGQVAVDPDSNYPFTLSAELDGLHLLRRDEVTGAASGRIDLSGDAEAARLTGRLATRRVEVSILGTLPPEVVRLDIVKDDGSEQAPAAGQNGAAAPPYRLDLDMTVDLPRQVFVRGRGLDSEWSGNLKVQGTADAPRVSGQISLVRGRLSIVGKAFTLQSGSIKLPEDPGAEPELDVVAQHQTEALVVTALVTGPVSNPELALSSAPELPEDEIVSRVLFNKGVGNLTALEAAQLAVALPQLAGGGGGFDVMAFIRQTIGVDVLQIDTVEGKDGPAPGVKAGKYVTDEVFLGVKQGATPQSGSVNVEVELTPNISVESEMNQNGQTKSGVKFKLDY